MQMQHPRPVWGVAPNVLLSINRLSDNLEARHLKGPADVEHLKSLISQGYDIKSADKFGNTLLSKALYSGASPEAIKFLVKSGADVNTYLEFDCLTPIMLAIKNNYSSEIIRLLINNGANVNISLYTSGTPLMVACMKKNPDIDIVRLLVYSGANLSDATLILRYIPYDHPKYKEIYWLLSGEHSRAARVIQNKMKTWLWAPFTRDGKMGLMPSKIYRDLFDMGFIRE